MKTRVQILGLSFSLVLLIVTFFVYHRLSRDLPPSPPNSSRIPVNDSIPRITHAHNHCRSIYNYICSGNPETSDPTGNVRPDIEGEKQAQLLQKKLIADHPDWNSDQIDDSLVNQIYSPVRTNRLISTFLWVRNTLEEIINLQIKLSFAEKNRILATIERVELEIPPPAAVYSDERELFTKNEVYFERTQENKLRLRVGGAYLIIAKSWFNIVFTLAHELAHSIDPCELKNSGYVLASYQKLKVCFLQNGLISTASITQECGPRDQFAEVFADWMAVQVTARALKSYSHTFGKLQMVNSTKNAVKDLCRQENDDEELELDLHPSPELRIEKIFGAHPEIREFLGCGPATLTLNYCSLESR